MFSFIGVIDHDSDFFLYCQVAKSFSIVESDFYVKLCVMFCLFKLTMPPFFKANEDDNSVIPNQFTGKVYRKYIDGNKEIMPSVTCRSVSHTQQQFNWDCGLSCVLMAFDAADLLDTKDTILANIEDICQKEGFGHSTWSIDLCYLIKHYAPQLRFSYTTTTIGVDPSYMNQVSIKEVISKVVLWARQPAVNPAFFRP